VRTGQPVAPPPFGSAVQEVFVMPVLPGGRCPDLVDDDANLPENSFVPPDEAPLDVPGSPSAGGGDGPVEDRHGIGGPADLLQR
jgi:hypothetical protein